jgi:hypothetical protein
LFSFIYNHTPLVKFLFISLFYRQFRLCITALQATRASGKAHTPIILIILYHTLAEKARVIFRLRRSDIIAIAIVILKPCGFSDILFASKTREANITRRKPNITAKQYHSPKGE